MDGWTVVPIHPSEVFLVLFNSYCEEATSDVLVSKKDDALEHLLTQINQLQFILASLLKIMHLVTDYH